MKFKNYLESIYERIDFGSEIEELIKQGMIPISPKMMMDLGYSNDEDLQAYHMTNAMDLKTLKGMNKKSQLSCFTKPSLELTKLPSKPNIVVKVQGRLLIEGLSDLYTFLDKDGRRWIKLDEKSQLKTGPGKKLKFLIDGIQKRIFKNKIYSTLLYKEYLKEITKLLDKGGYKLLNEHLKIITYNYNEVILDKVKILGAWDFNADKKQEIQENKIKYLGHMNASDLIKL